MQALFEFANGDTCADVVTHFCKMQQGDCSACCSSDEESLSKFLSLAVPLLSKGFATPLLYRMKHYGPASSYMKVGCSFCKLVPRVLQEMEHLSAEKADGELASLVDAFLHESGHVADGSSRTEQELQDMLADALEADQSFSAQNGLRRRKVIAEITRPDFHQSSMLIDCLIQPLEHGINFLLGHTKVLVDLRYLGRGHPDFDRLCRESRLKFMQVISGQLAQKLLREYVVILHHGLQELFDMGFAATPDSLNQIFEAVVFLCSDLYRRLHHDFKNAPFKLFRLSDLNGQAFSSSWTTLEQEAAKCSTCMDEEFSYPLLRQFEGLSSKSVAEQDSARHEIQMLLNDLATWSPVTSDSVEVKNGQTQWAVSRRGGQNVRNTRTSLELSLVQEAVNQNRWAQRAVSEETLPAKATSAGVLKMAGVKTVKTEDGCDASPRPLNS